MDADIVIAVGLIVGVIVGVVVAVKRSDSISCANCPDRRERAEREPVTPSST
jgi:uncharacterized membrane-anchored protein YhcB (DUF1043 family)